MGALSRPLKGALEGLGHKEEEPHRHRFFGRGWRAVSGLFSRGLCTIHAFNSDRIQTTYEMASKVFKDFNKPINVPTS